MEGDPQLWGSLPGQPRSAVINIGLPKEGERGFVRLEIFCANRRDPMRLTLDDLPSDRMATAIGYIVPIAIRMHHSNTPHLRRQMWAVWRTLSLADWAPGIRGCGTQKDN